MKYHAKEDKVTIINVEACHLCFLTLLKNYEEKEEPEIYEIFREPMLKEFVDVKLIILTLF